MVAALATKSLGSLPVPAGNSLASYLQQINDLPTLSSQEEQQLALRLRDHNDLDAARQLVLSQLRFVVHIARSYSGYGLPLADLVQEGNIGLMKAVKRFDPEVGVRLISFAVHWIRAEIHEYVIRNWRIVKIATTKAQRKLFFKLRSNKKRLGWFTEDEANAVAKDLGVDPKTVQEMEARLASQDAPFDAPATNNDSERNFSPASYLAAEHADPALLLEYQNDVQQQDTKLQLALEELDERTLTIVKRRWLSEKKATLHELAAEFGVSAERIRQLEANAFKKMRQQITL